MLLKIYNKVLIFDHIRQIKLINNSGVNNDPRGIRDIDW